MYSPQQSYNAKLAGLLFYRLRVQLSLGELVDIAWSGDQYLHACSRGRTPSAAGSGCRDPVRSLVDTFGLINKQTKQRVRLTGKAVSRITTGDRMAPLTRRFPGLTSGRGHDGWLRCTFT